MIVSVCPVCGKDAPGVEFVCTDFFLSGEQFPVYKCSGCGFRMTGSVPDVNSIGRYYQSGEYVSHSNTQQGLVNKLYHAVRSFMLDQKYKMVVRHSGLSSGILLDVGAGTGYFLQKMQNSHWETTGIEESEDARKYALANLGLQLFPGEHFWSLPSHSFNVITLWHVLEHLYHPVKYMEAFGRLVKPGGTLVIALPNPYSFDAGFYKEHWAAWDVPRHMWHFTPGNIVRMAEKNGFLIRNIRRLPFDAFYVSILSEKYRKSSFPVVRGMLVGFISWLFSLFNKNRCSSLVYIFKVKS